MDIADPDFGNQWFGGCPECGEGESLLAITGIKGNHIQIEIECPYCGRQDRALDPKIAERDFDKIMPFE